MKYYLVFGDVSRMRPVFGEHEDEKKAFTYVVCYSGLNEIIRCLIREL